MLTTRWHPALASELKRKCLTKAQKRQLLANKLKMAIDKRGRGVGARTEFVLSAKGDNYLKEYQSKQSMVFVSPGKSRYNKKAAEAELKEQGMDLCFDNKSEAGSSSSSGQRSSEGVRRKSGRRRSASGKPFPCLRIESDHETNS